MNKVILIGRLTRDPELRYSAETSNAMCTFTLAVDRGYSKQREEEMRAQGKPTADFPRIVAWGKTAELCGNYLQKGLRTAVEGRIQTGSYQNQEGRTVYTTDVIADRVEFIDWPEDGGSRSQGQYNTYNQERPQTNQGFNQDPGPAEQGFNHDIGSDNDDDDFIPFDDDSKIPF